MCLFKLHRFPRISTKPIKCYKKVTVISDNECKTEVKRHFFKLGDTIKSAENPLLGIFRNQLRGEVVHAFQEGFADEESLKMYNNNEYPHLKDQLSFVIECEIPPYTLYYLGKDNEIGASRIKTIKVV